ncbi:MAG: 5-formyltetrahydrofolate cyclo-ligase [Campylobacterota bacterium]|nr:5-formyltetrahydrofolate cyclo-ligase [Campylobacterota bacterium]
MSLTKKEFRTLCLDKMRNNSKHNKKYRDLLINKKLLNYFKKNEERDILIYYPLKIEADIRKTIIWLRRQKNRNIYVPFMESVSFKIVPFRLPLHVKKFGIFETANSYKIINKIDTALVPTVGIDKNFKRLGFGKGMYDRFFAKQKNIKKIFIQSSLCYYEKDICDDYDIKADMLITPFKTIECIQ